jgi:hypothetical protein
MSSSFVLAMSVGPAAFVPRCSRTVELLVRHEITFKNIASPCRFHRFSFDA